MLPIIKSKNKKIDDATRERVVELVINRGKTLTEVSSLLYISPSAVRDIVDTFIQTGSTAKPPKSGRRISRIEESHLDWLTKNMDEFAGRSVEWLTNKLNEHFQIQPPLVERTVEKAINNLTVYTLELMRAEPEGYNEPERIEGRLQWAQNIGDGPGNRRHFVYIDEAGFNLHITRRYGRVPQGGRTVQRVPCKHGPHISLVVAVDETGILACQFKRGVHNQETFSEFLEYQLFPCLKVRPRLLLMDNVKFHKTQQVKDLILEHGHSFLLLPPNSPHLNAAEYVFSNVKKTHVRQEVVQAETLLGHVARGLRRMGAAKAKGWIHEVERNFQRSLQGVPLGRLKNDGCLALPEGYQDPYAESWDDGSEHEEDREEGEDVEDRKSVV